MLIKGVTVLRIPATLRKTRSGWRKKKGRLQIQFSFKLKQKVIKYGSNTWQVFNELFDAVPKLIVHPHCCTWYTEMFQMKTHFFNCQFLIEGNSTLIRLELRLRLNNDKNKLQHWIKFNLPQMIWWVYSIYSTF